MNNYRSSGSNGRNGKQIPWWLIAVAFALAWPLGIVLLLVKLGQESGVIPGLKRNFQQREQSGQFSGTRRSTAAQAPDIGASKEININLKQPGTQRPQAGKPKARQSTGKLFMIIGVIVMGFFGIGTAMAFVDNLYLLSVEPLWVLESVLLPFILTGIGAGLFTFGLVRRKQARRFQRYLNLIGNQKTVSVSTLAKAFPARESAVRDALEDMIDAGVFGEQAYLDYGRNLLVLDGSGVKPEEEPQEKKAAVPETETGEENDLLRQIHVLQKDIENPELSRKISRVEEITQRILEFQKEHPDKAGELRKFLNYYLPTTLKILSAYAELENQGVEGENITATKQRIEGMMDMVVEGFERQLDKLFAGDMMDIAADITVMEQMMQGDGLTGREDEIGGH